MTNEELCDKLGAIHGVKAVFYDGDNIVVYVPDFKPLFINTHESLYNAEALPPMPPLGKHWPTNINARYDTWHQVYDLLRKWYAEQ